MNEKRELDISNILVIIDHMETEVKNYNFGFQYE